MITPDGTNAVTGFETIVGQASNGGYDKVKLYDSPSDDTFVTVPSYGLLLGDGYSLQGISFDEVHAFDTAYLHDSAGDDVFWTTPKHRASPAAPFLLYSLGLEVAILEAGVVRRSRKQAVQGGHPAMVQACPTGPLGTGHLG